MVDSFTNPVKALAEIRRLKPDILFLDIDMPMMDGLSLAKETIGHYGELVFVTAHQKYWKEAFNIHAFQFLLKPIKDEKLEALIEDLKEREKSGWLGLWQQRIQDFEEASKAASQHVDYIWLAGAGTGLDRVLWTDIVLFEKPRNGGNEVFIYRCDSKRYNKRNTTLAIVQSDVDKLEKKVKAGFWRINDQQIVNLHYMSSFYPNNKLLVLQDGLGIKKTEYPLNITRPEAIKRIENNKLSGRP